VCLFAAQPLALRLRGDSTDARAVREHPASAGAPPAPEEERPARRLWPALLACLAISALSLLLPATPTYDPWAWILWGHEITQFDLKTTGGPSWKPLPVLFTTVFSLFGHDLAPLLWLWIARAGGLLSLVMAFRVGRRLAGKRGSRVDRVAGWLAGAVAVAFLATTYNYARDAALGNSEPLLAALALWAFERHLDGRRDHALYLGFAAALLRPEAWPFLGLYGLWLWFREPALRLRVAAAGALIPVLWFGPELWGSGDPLRASARANDPNPSAAANAASPGLEVLSLFHGRTIWPIEATAFVGVVGAAVACGRSAGRSSIGRAPHRGRSRQRAQRAVLFLFGAGLAWLMLVALMTELGYAGNQRYLVVTTAAICVLGGVGVGRILQGARYAGEWLRARFGTAPAAAATALAFAAFVALAWLGLVPAILDKVDNTERVVDKLGYEASLWTELPGVIEKAGGRDRLLRCGNVYSGPYQTQMVAYELGVHGIEVGASPLRAGGGAYTPPPGVAFRTHTVPKGKLSALVDDDRFRWVTSNRRWRIETAPRADPWGRDCPGAGPRVRPRSVTPKLVSSR